MSRYEEPETREIAVPVHGRLPGVEHTGPPPRRDGRDRPPRAQRPSPPPPAPPPPARPAPPTRSAPPAQPPSQAEAPTRPTLTPPGPPPPAGRPREPGPEGTEPPRGRPARASRPQAGPAQADTRVESQVEPPAARRAEPPAPPPTQPPAASSGAPGGGRGRAAVRTFGEILITLGIVVLLFVVYELYVTNLMSARLQQEASAELDERWSRERELNADPIEGKAFARIYIPSFGVDWGFTIQEGVDAATLEIGPGHYEETAMPGEPGNFAVAGHRVGKGAPFNDLDLLNSCDAIVIETANDFYVYRVLPMPDEVAGWAGGKGGDPRCAGVTPLGESNPAYSETVGRVIVSPQRGDAVAPVPYQPAGVLPEQAQVPLLTLTTCHPQFSDRQRMIIHSVLTQKYRKKPGAGYEELLAEIGEA